MFSLIAVAISSLGLIGITAYSIRLRRKELSIRKVLGATVPVIILKRSRAYGVMIAIGFALACPIVYYLANSFLSGFAHRIELSIDPKPSLKELGFDLLKLPRLQTIVAPAYFNKHFTTLVAAVKAASPAIHTTLLKDAPLPR